MADPFFGIETGLRALRTAQVAMDTASHNIANVNTPGYSRQRVEVQVTDPYTTPSQWYKIGTLQIGTGVEARTITQARNNALDTQLRQGFGDREEVVARRDALAQAEDALGEPGPYGISASLTRLWNGFHELSGNAESVPLRSAVAAGAGAVTAAFRQTASRLNNVAKGIDNQIEAGINEINGIAEQIASLNIEIRKVLAQGDQPNDLRDIRGNLIDTLSKKANTVVIPAPDGTLTVQIGGVAVVRGTKSYPVGGLSDLTADGSLVRGELKGLLDAQTLVASYQRDLDGLATTLRDQVNTLHRAGVAKDGTTTNLDLFTGTGAIDLEVNPTITADPALLAAARVVPPATFAVGNGDNALRIGELATQPLTAGPLTSTTLRDFWGGVAARLGVEVKDANDALSGHDAFVKQLESRREALSGVSLDEEMADLVRFQRAYQAAAKLISISDEMTATLINAFGGRA